MPTTPRSTSRGGKSASASPPVVAARSTSREGKSDFPSTPSVTAQSISREESSEVPSPPSVAAQSISREEALVLASTPVMAARSISREESLDVPSPPVVAARSTFREGHSVGHSEMTSTPQVSARSIFLVLNFFSTALWLTLRHLVNRLRFSIAVKMSFCLVCSSMEHRLILT